MNKRYISLADFLMLIVFFILMLISVKPVFADEHSHEHDENHEEEAAHISEDTAALNAITTAVVSGGDISKTITLYGDVTLSPEHTSHVTARFAGRITRVYVEYGDTVKKGQVLASVESNSSLQTYNVTAPLSGSVIAKHANAGEVVSEQTLFTITDTSTLWAELKVFPSQASLINSKQTVVLQSDDMQTRSVISQLLPNTSGEPFRIARVKFKNPDDNWFPGLLVGAQVLIDKREVNLRVPLSALQQYENKTVVFIKEGDVYKPLPVALGIQDNQYAEVLEGLNAGQEIVTENSYLIKADLEKDGAEHSH
ncbi:MAG: efflux RND transporter periplasmic adaptor subunit [Pseudomonadota bacterium]|uniref:efflux RND transporter periplasmic adaptor subunit n=1 Tax=Methylophaga TaxID=40222 RepID=UPI0017665720|nr:MULTISPECIES: efflux RND transporter periplasmic adaptor subunit [Methylophaga]MEC9412231.1 efflux RND transporter periplasmic adaptor subunit [Pseudomonadota bacterium]WVI86730.1 efflux RND transporter periplasmic adaptor subunit [Methylophaga thalassica]HIC45407.1 HlyD family efflux transporter periplasmic adaptor subunit [Methylophaga sp.]HIM40263.1 HlyD family efflux transporter periplasmic adaptor subunit [Methylophaga aminisulfidivorans]